MDRAEYVKPDFTADAFAGTATYYAQYRVPYPKALTDDLIERAGVTGEGRLLDLACGPGRIAIPFASSFRDVWAIDLEPEMIAVGREQARQGDVANIMWLVGRAEDVEAEAASFELITIGEAFHRLDQRLIVRKILRWLSPGHCLATMGCYGIWKGNEPWQSLVIEVIRKWTGRGAGAGSKSTIEPRGPVQNQKLLQRAGFVDVESYGFAHPHVWTLDSIIGNLYSTSTCSKQVLGSKAEQFESELRRKLLAYDARGRYPETMRFGYTLARRPELNA